MFDAKKLLEALGTPAGATDQTPRPAQPAAHAAPPAAAPAAPAAAAPAATFGAGTLLSDLIGYAKDSPPNPPASSAHAEAGSEASAPAKPASSPDLTDHLLARAQEYLRSPQGNAAVNALVLGLAKFVAQSETTKKVAASAKAGGLALISDLTQRARRLQAPTQVSGATPQQLPAPATPAAGSPGATDPDAAFLILRTMIAAAAADGQIDAVERQRIMETVKQAGMDAGMVRLIEAEFANPASVGTLAASANTPEQGVQIYAAARAVIEPDKTEERVFLAQLAGALGLDPKLVASIDAAAAGVSIS